MLGTLPSLKKNLGAPLQTRRAMLETLFRHLDMVRLSAGAMMLMTLASCTGLIDGAGDGLTSQERSARKKWSEVALPVLKAACVGCHAGQRANIDFIKGDDDLAIRENLKAYEPKVINLEAPASSRLVSKGAHDGPELTLEQRSSVIDWLSTERDAETHSPGAISKVMATAAVTVLPCTGGLPDTPTCPTTHVSLADLPDIGPMLPGAEITFNAQPLQSGLYLTNIKLNGGTAGAYIEHPLFVAKPAGGQPYPDQLDRYFALKLNTKAGVADIIAGGADHFAGFGKDDQLEIHFKTVTLFKPDTGGGGGGQTGCRKVDVFAAQAANPIQAACASCHGGNNAGATAALDIRGATSADQTTLKNACNQIRTRVNLTTTDQSGLYLAPDPGSNTNHPFKFANAGLFTTYKTSVDVWVQAEKVAP